MPRLNPHHDALPGEANADIVDGTTAPGSEPQTSADPANLGWPCKPDWIQRPRPPAAGTRWGIVS